MASRLLATPGVMSSSHTSAPLAAVTTEPASLVAARAARRGLARPSTVLVLVLVLVALGGAALLATNPLATGGAAPAPSTPVARTSYAIGLSAGAGLRGVAELPADAFRRGLLDGLAGAPRSTSVMARPELLARMRETMRRLSEAEVAAVASRIDESRDR